MSKQDIWLVHPAIQPYREELFNLLDAKFSIRFVFVGWQAHNLKFLPSSGLSQWKALQARAFGPYRDGVSSALVKAASQGDYGIWITSALNWFPTHIGFPIVHARRKRFLLWTEDWWWAPGIEGRIAQAYGRLITRRADAVIAAGSKARAFAIENGADPRKVFIAPNSTVDLDLRPWSNGEVAEVRRRYVPDEGSFVFLYLNRIVDYKGLDILLRAFSSVQAQHVSAWLVVVGEGPLRSEYERLAEKLNVKNVTFVGKVEHDAVHLIYRACDVYVHPATFVESRVRAEAWGFTINEAMGLGLPVIATTAVGAAYDLIEDGENGYMVEAGDAQTLAKRMLEIATQPQTVRRMGDIAKKTAQTFNASRQFDGFAEAIGYAQAPRK